MKPTFEGQTAALRDILLDLAVLLNERESVADAFAAFSERLLDGARFDYAALVVHEPDGRHVRLVGSYPAWTMERLERVRAPAEEAGLNVLGQFPEGMEYVPAESGLPVVRALAEGGLKRIWAVPLPGDEGQCGAVTVGRRSGERFDEASLAFLRAASRLLAAAVRDEGRIAEAKREAARGAILNELAVLLNAGEPVDAMFERLRELLARAIDFDYLSLMVATSAGQELRMVGSHPELLRPTGSRYSFAEVQYDDVLANTAAVVEFQPDGAHGLAVARLESAGLHRMLTAALRHGDENLGLFSVGRRENLPFTDRDRGFVELLTTILGQAVANTLKIERLTTLAARSQVLNELAILLNAGEPIDAMFGRLPGLLGQALQFDYIALMVATESERELRLVGSQPELAHSTGARLSFDYARIDEILGREGRTTQYRPGVIDHPGTERLAEAGIRWCLVAVLQQGGESLGLFSIGRREDRPFDEGETGFLELVTTFLRQAVANQLKVERTETAAARHEVLNELSLLLNAGEPIEAFFSRLPGLLERILAFDYIALLEALPEPGLLRVVGSKPAAVLPPGEVETFEQAQIAAILETGSAITQYRTDRVTGNAPDRLRAAGIVRVLVCVLRQGDDILGLLSLGRRENARFNPADVAVIELVMALLGQAIAGRLRLKRIEETAARRQVLNELSLLLNAGEDVEALFGRLLSLLQQAISLDYVGLSTLDRPGWLRIVDARPEIRLRKGDVHSLKESQADQILETGAALAEWRTDRVEGPWPDAYRQAGLNRIVTSILRHGGATLGLFVVGRRPNRPFSEDELGFLDVVSTLLGQAIASQNRIEQATTEAQQSRLLNELAVLLSAGEPVETLFDRVQDVMLEAVDADYVSLLLGRQAGGEMRLVGSRPWIEFESGDTRLSPGEAGVEGILASGSRVLQYRTDHIDLDVARLLAGEGIRRVAAALVSDASGVLGILNMGRRKNVPFSGADLSFIDLVSTLLGQAEGNQHRVAQARQEAEEQRIVAEVAAAAARENHPTKLISALVPTIRRFVPKPFLGFVYPQGDDQALFLGRDREELAPITDLVKKTLNTGQEWVPEVAPHLPPGHPAEAFGIHAISCTVAESGGEGLGVLTVGSRQEGFVFHARDLRILRLVARIVGPAIAAASAAERTARERALYEYVLGSLSEAVILLDHEFHTVFANAEGLRIVNAVDPDRQFRTPEQHLPSLPRAARELFLEAARSNTPSRGRAPVRFDGDLRWYDFEMVALDHPVYHILVVASDVTAELAHEQDQARHREQMEQASRLAALGELIGGVAHELNNPLTAVLGFSELLARDPASEAFGEEIEIIHKEAARARNIVRDLLFIARPGPIERGEVAIKAVVSHIERLRRSAWAKEGIAVEIETGGLQLPVWGNEHQVTQVLLNLVTNAEHAVRGTESPRIGIEAGVQDGLALIRVTDNGRGMDTATMDRIFEPFFTTKQGQGTGLGLSLSRTIVSAHGGRIEVTSKPGEGTTFMIWLPLATTEAPGSGAVAAGPPRVARVLLVDDDPSVAEVCRRLIESLGHSCVAAATSAEALDRARAERFDVIVCDYRLGAETADSVVEGLEAIAPELVARTVIATGATTDAGVLKLTGRHGLRLVAKPYGLDALTEAIDAAMSA